MIYEFTPTQDLHGYTEPWAPGAGKNLFDQESFTWADSSVMVYQALPIENGTYTFSSDIPSSTSASVFILPGDVNSGASTGTNGVSVATPRTITVTDGYYTIASRVYSDTPDPKNYNYQLEAGSTATAYAPYSNICPPEGYDIWDPVQDKMIQVYSGYVDAEARKLYLHPVYEEYDGEELVGPWMSSMDKYTEEGTPTEGAFVVDMGGDVTEYDITAFMLQTLLDSLGIRRFITSGAMLLNSLMDQAQGRVRSEEELLNRSFPIHVIAIGKELPSNLVITKPVSDVLPVLPGKIKI